jgi:hypothetical protein
MKTIIHPEDAEVTDDPLLDGRTYSLEEETGQWPVSLKKKKKRRKKKKT